MAFISNDVTDYIKINAQPEIGFDLIKKRNEEIKKTSQRNVVCSQCGKLGHNKKSTVCEYNIKTRNELIQKLKDILLKRNILDKLEDELEDVSKTLGVTPNMCRSLYREIPAKELLSRQLNIDAYIKTLEEDRQNCSECSKELYTVHKGKTRIWKNKIVCDNCWGSKETERDKLWRAIERMRPIKCSICDRSKTTKHERFHYDHLNMFDKEDSVCSMVNNGVDLYDIYTEIKKCQVLCFECHTIVTDVESKLGFTRIKQSLTSQFNNEKITESDVLSQKREYQQLYEQTMQSVYRSLRDYRSKKA
ncbi:hypothetical protein YASMINEVIRUS_378 [Yasminevirus sp. GU-2018]|uniref:Uncharacterized protein n=1 Tax=Yasminevirus sp. GU-2018 TaxID=2420051 RepID=A0A5K0U7Z6_9VIRU|nr:hypothetical protein YASMINEVIRUS_378 [Yasminevirus sp. GU-2018]